MNKPQRPQLPGHLNAHQSKQPGRQQLPKPVVAQPKGIVLQPQTKHPAAPPVYRPQPVPKVLQARMSNGKTANEKPSATVKHPTAPPVYRPQPTPRVLQRKTAASLCDSAPRLKPPSPIAPPVYRPQPTPKVLQRKVAGQSHESPSGDRLSASKPALVCQRLSTQKASAAKRVNNAVQAKMVNAQPGIRSNIQPARTTFASPRAGKGSIQRMETKNYDKEEIVEATNEEETTVLGVFTNEPSLSLEQLAEQAQKIVPYQTLEHLNHATKFMIKDGVYLHLAWREYQKSSSAQNIDVGALMYTIRNQAQKNFWAAIEGQTVEDMANKGAIYSPWVETSDSGQKELKHNMAVNRIWFLGVIHSSRKITLVTLLNEQSLTRGYSGHEDLQGPKGPKGVSALGREALAATSTHNGSGETFYQPQQLKTETFPAPYNPIVKTTNLNTQEFTPTGQTKFATIDDITYPDNMTSQQAMEELKKRGVHVTSDGEHNESVYKTASLHRKDEEKDILIIAEKNKTILASPDFINQLGAHVRKTNPSWTNERILKLLKKNFPEKFNTT